MKKIALLMAVLAATMMLASCGEKCANCGENSTKGKEIAGEFICQDCIDEVKDALSGLAK